MGNTQPSKRSMKTWVCVLSVFERESRCLSTFKAQQCNAMQWSTLEVNQCIECNATHVCWTLLDWTLWMWSALCCALLCFNSLAWVVGSVCTLILTRLIWTLLDWTLDWTLLWVPPWAVCVTSGWLKWWQLQRKGILGGDLEWHYISV